MRLWAEQFNKQGLLRRIGGLEQVAGVRLVTLGDGAERGVRVLEFRTGSGFEFDVIVDRAFDIGRCEINGMALGWESGVGYSGPWFAEQTDLGWLRTWGGGLLTTCGLDHALFFAEDTAEQYHYAPKARPRIRAPRPRLEHAGQVTGYGDRWDGDTCVLYAEGEVLQASMFGEHLILRRPDRGGVGEAQFTIHDEVENVGWDPTPHMLLYHVNIGFPVVDEGAEIARAHSAITPRGDYPAEGYRTLEAPEPAYFERVFEHDPIAERGGTVPVGIVNRARGIGAYEIFNLSQLPFHFVWRMLGEGSYVVGIEPSTNRTGGRLDARERGELIIMKPGESGTTISSSARWSEPTRSTSSRTG